MSRYTRSLTFSIVATFGLFAPLDAALAQPASDDAPDATDAADAASHRKARADELFQEGRRRMSEERHLEACVLFEESLSLDVAGGTLLNLSTCYEATGRFASADACLERAAMLAREKGRSDAIEFIDRERARIAARIDRLELSLPPLPAGAVVTLDGRRIEPSRSATIPVDAGDHVLTIVAPDHEAQEHRIEVPPTGQEAGRFVEVRIPPLQKRVRQRTPLPARRPSRLEGVHGPAAATTEAEAGPEAMFQAGVATTALGGAALAAGAVVGILAAVTWSDVEDRCPVEQCNDREALAGSDRASLFAELSTGLLVGGGLAGGVGVGLLVAAPSSTERRVALRMGTIW